MPNWTENFLKIEGSKDDVSKFITSVKGYPIGDHPEDEPRAITFNAIIPMPKILQTTKKSSNTEMWAAALDTEGLTKFYPNRFQKELKSWEYWVNMPWAPASKIVDQKSLLAYCKVKHPKDQAKGQQLLDAVKETGFSDWYQWSIVNWGVKWDASSIQNIGYYESDALDSKDYAEAIYRFNTPWGWPEPIVDKLRENFPNLKIEFRFRLEDDEYYLHSL